MRLTSPRTAAVLACLVLLIQALPWMSRRWVEDESWYSIPAYTFLEEGRIRNPTFATTDFESQADMRPPAMPLAISASFRLFGAGVLQARLPSLLAAVGVVWVVYLLGAMLAGRSAALLAAFLAATDNFLFLAARTTRPEACVALFGTLGVYLYLLARKHGSARIAALSGLALGVAINFHVTALAACCSVAILLLRDHGLSVWRRARAWSCLAGFLVTLAPFAYRLASNPTNYAAFQEMYGRGQTLSTAAKLQAELIRYSDFIGLGSQRFPLPFPVPLRVHIALLVVAALIFLYRRNSSLARTVVICVVPNLLLWAYMVNKSSRYFAAAAPWLALLLAFTAVHLYRAGATSRLAVAVCVLVAASQLTGNLVFLARARSADYNSVSASLQRIIPRSESAYGAITFWMALHDRQYYSYDRTPFDYAITFFRPGYLILNDRVMERGSGYGYDNFAGLRRQAQEFVLSRARLAGIVPSAFYGTLSIYKVEY